MFNRNKNYRADLHNHTIYSDGILTPLELIKEAYKKKIKYLGVTDHDTTKGISQAILEAKNYGINIISGMEMSTKYDNENVHIICLFKDRTIPSAIADYENDLKEKRTNRAIEMMNRISSIYGLKVDINSLVNNSNIITRGNMLRNIMDCNNLTYDEAKFYISTNSKAYIPATKLTTEEGLNIAKRADCLTILAHPGLIDKSKLNYILNLNFDGIEAIYPLHSKKETNDFITIAKDKNLFISAGSDCHGDESHSNVGTSTLSLKQFSIIARKINYLKEDFI